MYFSGWVIIWIICIIVTIVLFYLESNVRLSDRMEFLTRLGGVLLIAFVIVSAVVAGITGFYIGATKILCEERTTTVKNELILGQIETKTVYSCNRHIEYLRIWKDGRMVWIIQDTHTSK